MHNFVTGALPQRKSWFCLVVLHVAALGSSPAQSAPPADGKVHVTVRDGFLLLFIHRSSMLKGYAGRKALPLKPLSHKEDREVTVMDSRAIEMYLRIHLENQIFYGSRGGFPSVSEKDNGFREG